MNICIHKYTIGDFTQQLTFHTAPVMFQESFQHGRPSKDKTDQAPILLNLFSFLWLNSVIYNSYLFSIMHLKNTSMLLTLLARQIQS